MRRAPAAVLLVLLAGCSPRKLAVNALADGLSGTGDVFASDDDPELVRDAAPFALKTVEALLAEAPEHRGLLLQACSGFATYAYAFVQADAEEEDGADPARAAALRARALRLYLRAREYGLRGLELSVPGAGEALRRSPEAALARAEAAEVPLLYWTGAAWGGAIGLGKDRPDLVADVPAVKALLTRALALEEAWDGGALHEAMIALEGLPEMMGGSPARAREHYARALALSRGEKASPHVALAEAVAVPAQDRREFTALLEKALAVDPDAVPRLRMANLVAQRRARALLARAGDLFLDEEAP